MKPASAFARLFGTLALAAAVGAGCGGESSEGPPAVDASGAVDASNNPGVDAGSECDDPCLAPPEHGFQVGSTGTTIQPGEDVEYCETVLIPGDASDTYYVKRFESQMTLGSHHLIVQAAAVGSDVEAALPGPGEPWPCTGPMGPDGEGGAGIFSTELLPVTGAQHPYHEETFPDGVGRIYHGGQKLIFDYHYLNVTDAPLPARALVNFHTADPSEVQIEARDFAFMNFNIPTPAHQDSSFTKSCQFSADVMVYKLIRHTHQWGTDFTAWYDGGDQDGEEIFTTPNYETTDFIFSEPVMIPAGQGFTWQCNYHNDTERELHFGTEATDEMCILFGVWWPVDPNAEVGFQGCF